MSLLLKLHGWKLINVCQYKCRKNKLFCWSHLLFRGLKFLGKQLLHILGNLCAVVLRPAYHWWDSLSVLSLRPIILCIYRTGLGRLVRLCFRSIQVPQMTNIYLLGDWKKLPFCAECTVGMVWGLTSPKHYGNNTLWHYGNEVLILNVWIIN